MNLQQANLAHSDRNKGLPVCSRTPTMPKVAQPRSENPEGGRQFEAKGGQRYVTRPYGSKEAFQVDVIGESVEFSGVSSVALDLGQIKGLHAILGDIITRAELDAAREMQDLPDQGSDVPDTTARPPFLMIGEDGVLGIYDHETAEPLPKDWTGICRDVGDATSFWYIGAFDTCRSFDKLAARTYTEAAFEVVERGLRAAHTKQENVRPATVLVHEITSDDVLDVLRAHSLVVADSHGKPFSQMAEEIFDDLDFSVIERRAMVAGNQEAMQAFAIRDAIAEQLFDKGVIKLKRVESLEGFSYIDLLSWLMRARVHNPVTGHSMDCWAVVAIKVEMNRREDEAKAMPTLRRAVTSNLVEVQA